MGRNSEHNLGQIMQVMKTCGDRSTFSSKAEAKPVFVNIMTSFKQQSGGNNFMVYNFLRTNNLLLPKESVRKKSIFHSNANAY